MSVVNISDHVYVSSKLHEIIEDTVNFFDSTPVYPIPITERFCGTGVYGLYCTAKSGVYSRFNLVNRTILRLPTYIGKAVPKGWRQGRGLLLNSQSYELNNRVREHSRSIDLAESLDRSDFFCRFIILEGRESDLIGTVEAALIRKYKPIWNTLIDGFGNHDPGKGRYEQAKSDWDICHPGRPWAEKCQGKSKNQKCLLEAINEYMSKLNEENV